MTALPKTLSMDALQRERLPFYTGRITYSVKPENYRSCVNSKANRVLIRVKSATGALVDVSDGKEVKHILWEPYTADVTEAVRNGRTIYITLVNTRRNVFGPMHILPKECRICHPGSFTTTGSEWSDAYTFIDATLGNVEFIRE